MPPVPRHGAWPDSGAETGASSKHSRQRQYSEGRIRRQAERIGLRLRGSDPVCDAMLDLVADSPESVELLIVARGGP